MKILATLAIVGTILTSTPERSSYEWVGPNKINLKLRGDTETTWVGYTLLKGPIFEDQVCPTGLDGYFEGNSANVVLELNGYNGVAVFSSEANCDNEDRQLQDFIEVTHTTYLPLISK